MNKILLWLKYIFPPHCPNIDDKIIRGLALEPAEKVRIIRSNPVAGILGLICGAVIPTGGFYTKILILKLLAIDDRSPLQNFFMAFWCLVAAMAGLLSLISVFSFWRDLLPKERKFQVVRILICIMMELWWLLAEPDWAPKTWEDWFLLWFPCFLLVLIFVTNAISLGAVTAISQRRGDLDGYAESHRHHLDLLEKARLEVVEARAETLDRDRQIAAYQDWHRAYAAMAAAYPFAGNGESGTVIKRIKLPSGEFRSQIEPRKPDAAKTYANGPLLLIDPVLGEL